MSTLTLYIDKANKGDDEAVQTLFDLFYESINDIAHRLMRNESINHTLQGTALVNEFYLDITNKPLPSINDRKHFLALSVRRMRQILIDHARKKDTLKRTKPNKDSNEPLNFKVYRSYQDIFTYESASILEAIQKLESIDSVAADVATLRFVFNLKVKIVARDLEISETTVKNKTKVAQARIRQILSSENE